MENFVSTCDFDEARAASSLLEQLSSSSHRTTPSPLHDAQSGNAYPRVGEATSLGYTISSTTTTSASGQLMEAQGDQGRNFYTRNSEDGAHYQVLDDMQSQVTTLIEGRGQRQGAGFLEAKIPRPPNAFMIYANEFRRVLAAQYPRESNKEISVRLGTLWKHMDKDVKDKYFHLSRVVDAEHKKRYPNYVYNPKEARMRKAIRDQTREQNRLFSGKIASPKRAHSGMHMQNNDSPQNRRMLELSKGKMPSGGPGGYSHPQWPGEGVNHPYGGGGMGGGGGGNEGGFLDIPYQPHDGGIYANIVNSHSQSQWYPYPMQQDVGSMPYAPGWSQHTGSAAGYAAQRVQYGQMQGQADAGPQTGFSIYDPQSAEQSAGQQQQQQLGNSGTKMAKRVDNTVVVKEKPSAAAGSSFQGQLNANGAQAPNGLDQQQNNANVGVEGDPASSGSSSQQVKQESGSITPQMSPTKAYHKYLQGAGLSPVNSWPFVRLSPSDDARAVDTKGHINYMNEGMPQFTYYDYGMMSGGEYGMPMQQDVRMQYAGNHGQPFSAPPSKMEEFARGLRQFRPTTIKQTEEVSQKSECLNISKIAKVMEGGKCCVDEYSTVTLSIMTEEVAKKSGGRVIATYETQANIENTEKVGRGMPDISGSDEEVRVTNTTFSFMQDPSLKNILKSIDAVDSQKIIQQNEKVCVITNNSFEEQSNLAGSDSDNSLDSV